MLTTMPKPSTQKLLESRMYLYMQTNLLVLIKRRAEMLKLTSFSASLEFLQRPCLEYYYSQRPKRSLIVLFRSD